jgi:hypothetical protein
MMLLKINLIIGCGKQIDQEKFVLMLSDMKCRGVRMSLNIDNACAACSDAIEILQEVTIFGYIMQLRKEKE